MINIDSNAKRLGMLSDILQKTWCITFLQNIHTISEHLSTYIFSISMEIHLWLYPLFKYTKTNFL